MKALAGPRDERYATAEELQRDLEEELQRMGGAPRSRELGALVAGLFADARAQRKETIEAQLGRANSASSGEYARLEPVVLCSGSFPSVSGASITSSSAPAVVPRKRGGGGFVVAATAGVGSLLAIIAIVLAARRPPAPAPVLLAPDPVSLPAPRPAAAAREVEITVESIPGAKLYLDDVELEGNPATHKAAADGSVHRIRAEARGHEPRTIQITFDKMQKITLGLDKIARPSADRPRAPKPLAPKETATPAPQPDCSVPFYVDDRGIKRIRAECR
jgi:hypothetical protein